MITLEKYIAGVTSRGERQKLANILTRLKMDFGSAFVRGGGPTDASKYDEIPVDAFDRNSGKYVYILIERDAVSIYQPVNKMWQVFNLKNNRLEYVYSTPAPLPGIFSKDAAVLYCAELTGKKREPLKMGDKKLRIWINKVNTKVFKPINKTQRWWNNRVEKFDQIWSGSDRIVMNHFIAFIQSVFDSTGKISNTELIQRMLGGNYIIDIDLLTPARLRNVLRKIQEDLGDLYPTLE